MSLVVELFPVAVKSAVGWGVKKALDILYECFNPACGCRGMAGRISNCDHNDLECTNCHVVSRQFTNACKFTVSDTGKVAQIGLKLGGEWHFETKRWGFLNSNWQHVGIYVPGCYLFDGLAGSPLVEKNYLRGFNSGKTLSCDEFVWNPTRQRQFEPMRLKAPITDVDWREVSGKVLCLDAEILSRYGDVLFKERDVFKCNA